MQNAYKSFQNPIRAHFVDLCLKTLSEVERQNLALFDSPQA
jgi:hypothetical protein